MDTQNITDNIAKFKATHNIYFLAKAVTLVLKQGRFSELIYGSYCNLFFQPSSVKNCENNFSQYIDAIKNNYNLWFSKNQLVKSFGKKFNVHSLPSNFLLARSESVVHNMNNLVVGEYAENSARIAYITRKSCTVTEFYNQTSGVRHIHSILECNNSGEYLVSTGDSCKFLDLWASDGCKLSFVKRIKKQFAGYTAAISINNRYFFGTDFSSRPNYIETLDGSRYFYPEIAYKFITLAFYSFLDRYLVSINSEMPQFGEKMTLSILDTFEEKFVFCDYLDRLQKDS